MTFEADIKRKYNIVFIIDGLGMGGAERMMVSILQNMNNDIFLPRVCFFQERESSQIIDDLHAIGVPVDFLPVRKLSDLTVLLRLRRYLRRVNADLIHAQLEFADIFGNFIATMLGIPSVSTVHTLPPENASVKTKMHQKVEWFFLRWFCDRVIAVSESAHSYHLKVGKLKEGQMLTVYNGIDISSFAVEGVERNIVRHELDIPLDAHLMTTVAVLRKQKGIQFMLHAMPELVKADPQAYYLIVGDGPYKNALREEAGALLEQNRVIFTGMRKDIPRILAASDIFILPTLTEALPTVLVEAMACQLPIIASDVGGIPEMVVDGWSGYLVSPMDSNRLMERCSNLLVDKGLRNAMGKRGWQSAVEKFDIGTQVEKLQSLYLEMIKLYDR